MGNKKNQKVRKEMIIKYGEKCFIEELHIRDKREIEKEFRLYGKKQRKIMDELTYHHIIEKCKGRRNNRRKWSYFKKYKP